MDLIEEKNISKEFLFNILDRVYMSPTYDSDGDIMISETHDVYILIKEKQKCIKFMCVFQENKELERKDLLEQTNEIVLDYPINAAIAANGGICFMQNIFFDGGVTEKNFVITLKKFMSIITAIGTDQEFTLLEK